MALLKWIFALSFVAAAVAFAVANPQDIALTWSPLHDSLHLPLYAITLGFMGIGFLLGTIATWLGTAKIRKERRQYKKENKKLEKELNKREKEAQDHIIDTIDTAQTDQSLQTQEIKKLP